MSTEYGIFNAEGIIDRGFWSEGTATIAWAKEYAADDPDCYWAEICSEHENEPADGCEACEECQHENTRQVSEDDVECLDCGLVSA